MGIIKVQKQLYCSWFSFYEIKFIHIKSNNIKEPVPIDKFEDKKIFTTLAWLYTKPLNAKH